MVGGGISMVNLNIMVVDPFRRLILFGFHESVESSQYSQSQQYIYSDFCFEYFFC
jgi:hypothetical protein